MTRPKSSYLTSALAGALCNFSICCCSLYADTPDATQLEDYQPTFKNTSAHNPSRKREYKFGVFPLHNPVHLFKVYDPMLESINADAKGFRLKLDSSKDYASYESKVFGRQLDFAIINPYQAIKAEAKGYRIFAKMGDDDRMRGIIVVRKDAGIKTVQDLKGSVISFPAPTAMAASIMTKLFLKRQGFDVRVDAKPMYVGSQDSAVMNVFLRITKAGCTWPPTWDALKKERPDVISELEIKWRTNSLPSLALVARDDIPAEHVAAVLAAITQLHRAAAGQKILATMGIPNYEAANSQTYNSVRDFMKEYVSQLGDPLGEVK